MDEKRTDNLVTCRGIGGAQWKVSWSIEDLPGSTGSAGLSDCAANAVGSNCGGQGSLLGFTADRPSGDVSTMTINPNIAPTYVSGTTLVCIVRHSNDTRRNTTRCAMDLICEYLPSLTP